MKSFVQSPSNLKYIITRYESIKTHNILKAKSWLINLAINRKDFEFKTWNEKLIDVKHRWWPSMCTIGFREIQLISEHLSELVKFSIFICYDKRIFFRIFLLFQGILAEFDICDSIIWKIKTTQHPRFESTHTIFNLDIQTYICMRGQ